MPTGVNSLIMNEPPLWTAGASAYPFSRELAKRFTIPPRFEDDTPLELFERAPESDAILLPRGVCPVGSDDRRAEGQDVAIDCSIEPRNADQAKVFNDTLTSLQKGMSGVVQSPTGSGKTALAIWATAKLGKLPLIVVPQADILEGWYQELLKHTDLGEADIGLIRQDKCDVVGKRAVLAMLPSLAKWAEDPNRYPQWVKDIFGVMWVDECHRVPAETLQPVASMFPALRRVGLSATPERADGKETLVFAHFGPIIAQGHVEQMVPRVLRIRSNWKCPRNTVTDKVTGEKKSVRISHTAQKHAHVTKLLAKHTARNDLVGQQLVSCWKKDRRTVVFSGSLEHLDRLREIAVHNGVPYSETAKYVGGMKQKDLDKASVKPLIFATYQMMSEGTNIPWLDTAVLASPKSKVAQVVGRIRREYPDKKPPIVIDVIDEDSPVFQKFAQKRLKWFSSINCEVMDF